MWREVARLSYDTTAGKLSHEAVNDLGEAILAETSKRFPEAVYIRQIVDPSTLAVIIEIAESTRPTLAEIEAAMTPLGGYTRATLASWGVPWPPRKGWKKRLVEGL